MQVYIWYLTMMSVLFAASAGVLLCAALGLTLFSCVVAAGFHFFRRLL